MKKTHLGYLLLVAFVAMLSGCGGSGVGGSSGGGSTGSSGATAQNAVLKGTYVFSMSGATGNGSNAPGTPVFIAGSFTADGAGNISGGTEDYNEIPGSQKTNLSVTGTYSIGSDGRGTLNITSQNQTFKFAVETNGHGQLIRFDSGGTGSGTFDLQSSASLPTGSFAFEWNGYDKNESATEGSGAFSLSSGNISSGLSDLNNAGNFNTLAVKGSFQSPNSNGRGTATITYGTETLNYAYDVVSSSRVILIETDGNAGTVGEADLQSSGLPGVPAAGSYIITINGLSGVSVAFALAGEFGFDGVSSITSQSDVTEDASGTLTQAAITGTFASSNSFSGVTVSGRAIFSVTFPDGTPASFVAYLYAPGTMFLMEEDSTDLTFGRIVPQAAGPFPASSLTGAYGLNFTGIDANGAETDVAGQITASGTSTLSGGTVDINDEDELPSTFPNNAISGGAYSAVNTTSGRGTVTFTAAGATFNFVFYFISPSQIVFVENDQNFFSLGAAQAQPTIP